MHVHVILIIQLGCVYSGNLQQIQTRFVPNIHFVVERFILIVCNSDVQNYAVIDKSQWIKRQRRHFLKFMIFYEML